MSLGTIVNQDIAKVDAETTVVEAAKKMAAAKIGVLMVTENNGIVGIFSERDILNRVVAEEKDPAFLKVGEVSTKDLITVPMETAPTAALSQMIANNIRHLPVVEGDQIVGIISIRDLMTSVVKTLAVTNKKLQEQIEALQFSSG